MNRMRERVRNDKKHDALQHESHSLAVRFRSAAAAGRDLHHTLVGLPGFPIELRFGIIVKVSETHHDFHEQTEEGGGTRRFRGGIRFGGVFQEGEKFLYHMPQIGLSRNGKSIKQSIEQYIITSFNQSINQPNDRTHNLIVKFP